MRWPAAAQCQRFFGLAAAAPFSCVVKVDVGAAEGFSLSFFGFLTSRFERT
jgi:hypothetical protein